MKLIKYPDRSQWDEILKRPVLNTESLFDTIRDIINRVRVGGDRTVMEYEAMFDKAELTSLAVTLEEIEACGYEMIEMSRDLHGEAQGVHGENSRCFMTEYEENFCGQGKIINFV